jgi:hypothetical protein
MARTALALVMSAARRSSTSLCCATCLTFDKAVTS